MPLSRYRLRPVDHQALHLDDLEIARLDPHELAQRVDVPARVGRAADEIVAAVVGQDHAVLLQRRRGWPCTSGAKPDDVEIGRRRTRMPIGGRSSSCAARPMARRRHVGAARLGEREAQRVLDRPCSTASS